MGNDKLFQKRKIKAENELRRKQKKKLTIITILIICEGLTEYNYFNEMRRALRGKGINILLEKPQGSAPINIVDFALEYCEKNDGVDDVFCVFDRDEHTTFQTALDKINNYKSPTFAKSKPLFNAIISNPCFEIWLLIHFKYTTKSYSKNGSKSSSTNVYNDLLKVFPGYSKTMMNLFSQLNSQLTTALENAKKLSTYNVQTDTINPSTNMHELIDFIYKMVKE